MVESNFRSVPAYGKTLHHSDHGSRINRLFNTPLLAKERVAKHVVVRS